MLVNLFLKEQLEISVQECFLSVLMLYILKEATDWKKSFHQICDFSVSLSH